MCDDFIVTPLIPQMTVEIMYHNLQEPNTYKNFVSCGLAVLHNIYISVPVVVLISDPSLRIIGFIISIAERFPGKM